MPQQQTGGFMTYLVDGRQYIVVAVGGGDGAEFIAFRLPAAEIRRQ
jgi:quinoprotein glucose dehydrogenase